MIVPLTCPASEFQVTKSPTLNRFTMWVSDLFTILACAMLVAVEGADEEASKARPGLAPLFYLKATGIPFDTMSAKSSASQLVRRTQP